jgi:hypothetical protein
MNFNKLKSYFKDKPVHVYAENSPMYQVPQGEDKDAFPPRRPDPSTLDDSIKPSIGPEDLVGAGLAGGVEALISSAELMRELGMEPKVGSGSNVRVLNTEPAMVDDPTQIISPEDQQAWFDYLKSQNKNYAFGGPVKGNQEQIYNTFGAAHGGVVPERRRKLKDLIRQKKSR